MRDELLTLKPLTKIISSGVWGQSPHLGIVKGGALNELLLPTFLVDTRKVGGGEGGKAPFALLVNVIYLI